jgi:hypothetical protein
MISFIVCSRVGRKPFGARIFKNFGLPHSPMAGDRRRIDDRILNHDGGPRLGIVLLDSQITVPRPGGGQELVAAPIY